MTDISGIGPSGSIKGEQSISGKLPDELKEVAQEIQQTLERIKILPGVKTPESQRPIIPGRGTPESNRPIIPGKIDERAQRILEELTQKILATGDTEGIVNLAVLVNTLNEDKEEVASKDLADMISSLMGKKTDFSEKDLRELLRNAGAVIKKWEPQSAEATKSAPTAGSLMDFIGQKNLKASAINVSATTTATVETDAKKLMADVRNALKQDSDAEIKFFNAGFLNEYEEMTNKHRLPSGIYDKNRLPPDLRAAVDKKDKTLDLCRNLSNQLRGALAEVDYKLDMSPKTLPSSVQNLDSVFAEYKEAHAAYMKSMEDLLVQLRVK